MDTEKTDVKDWNGVELWLAELIEQKKADAKRWFIIAMVLLAALVLTNGYWIYTFSTYEYVQQFSDGINSINTGTQGDIINEPGGEN